MRELHKMMILLLKLAMHVQMSDDCVFIHVQRAMIRCYQWLNKMVFLYKFQSFDFMYIVKNVTDEQLEAGKGPAPIRFGMYFRNGRGVRGALMLIR